MPAQNAGKGKVDNKPINGNDGDNTLDASAATGSNKINGGDGNDNIIGSGLYDFINAGDGNDIVFGGLGDDLMHGGDGFDTAVFSGSVFDYLFGAGKGNAITVSGADGFDTLKQFEALQFDDYTYYLDGRNNDPFTRADAVATDEDTALVGIDVLANDMDIDGDSLTIASVSGGAAGSSVSTDGATVAYDPGTAFQSLAEGVFATDTFIYTAIDGNGGSKTETVTVTIEGRNDAPVFGQASYGFAIDENNAAGAAVGQVGATDIDIGDDQFYAITGGTGMGLFSVDDDGNITADGALDYETAASYSLEIEVRDRTTGGLTDSTSVTVDVNDLVETGPLDLVVVGYADYYYYYNNNGVGILEGNGDGTFEAPLATSSGLEYSYYGEYNYAVALGDVNNDGTLDVVVGGQAYADYYYYYGYGSENSLSVILNNGDGTLAAPVTYSSELGYDDYYYYGGGYEDVQDVELVDLNGDGNLDMIASGYGYSDYYYYYGNGDGMSVLMGNGDGTFQAATTYSIQPDNYYYYDYEYGRDVDLADVNGDGHLDAVVAGYSDDYYGHQGGIAVLLGNGDGTFQTATNHASGVDSYYDENLSEVVLADFNNDGEIDIVSGGNANDYYSSGHDSLSIMLGNGDGTFQGATTMSSGLGYTSGSTYENTTAMQAADLNGDGNIDLVVGGNSYGYYGSGNEIAVLLGNGDGTFQAPALYDLTNSNSYAEVRDLVLGDFDGDGTLDIAATDVYSSVFILSGNGDGTFDAPVSYDDGVDYAYALAAGDMGDLFA